MQRHQPPRDTQPQAHALLAAYRLIPCNEGLEDPLLLIDRDPNPGVAHPEVQVRRRHFAAQHDLALGGEFSGVAE